MQICMLLKWSMILVIYIGYQMDMSIRMVNNFIFRKIYKKIIEFFKKI